MVFLPFTIPALRISSTQRCAYTEKQNRGKKGRYDFLYDISRIEKAKALDENFESGFAIILTNDSAYWSSPYTKNTVDASFRIHEGRTITGSLSWGEKAGNGTTKGREESIELIGNYKIAWLPFSNIEVPCGEFRYCLIEV